MKKLIVTLLVLVQLLMAFGVCIAETATASEAEMVQYEIEPILMTDLDISAREWCQNEETRALLTIFLAMEYNNYLQENNLGSFDVFECLFNSSYVGREGSFLAVVVCDETQCVLLTFDVNEGSIIAIVIGESDDFSSLAMKIALEESCKDGVYENDESAMIDVALQIVEELG